jgi:D-tyrosyl-tRNA(Tyr) deacylase
MRAVVQRVREASVCVEGTTVGAIGKGLLVFVGVGAGDGPDDVRYVAEKVRGLRVFEDDQGKMNWSVVEAGGAVLVVSQFTLLGDVRKGRRPSFEGAARPEIAGALYEDVVRDLRASGLVVETGTFQASMHVHLVNDGPVTILLDSGRAF